ncbi:MAG: glutamyl-tRNA reductase [Terriglobales bacterium]
MNLLLIGISHHTAPVEQREAYAISAQHLPRALRQLLAWPGVRDALILSTCNRVELLLATEAESWDPWPALAAVFGRDLSGQTPHFYCHRGPAAVRHLFRVAASLDSQVIGEPQILGQIKAAHAAARAAGGMRGGLHPLLARAFSTAKRARRETGLGRHAVSISRTAAGLALQIFGSLDGRCVLLIGAGETGALAARHFLRQGASRLLVASRTPERAAAVAARHQGAVIPFGAWGEAAAADIIISCTGASRPILDRADVAALLARRRSRPLLLLDIAVPRDIEPDAGQLDNAFLYNIDDLRAAVDQNLAERQREAARAEALIEQGVDKFLHHARGAQAGPAIQALRAQCEQLRQRELERLRPKLASLPEPERAQVEAWMEALSRGLMQKWLHRPQNALKAAARAGAEGPLAEALEQLFAPPAPVPAAVPEPAAAAVAALAAAPVEAPVASAALASDGVTGEPAPLAARVAHRGVR